MTVGEVFGELIASPHRLLIQRWNWKAAMFSASLRGALFLFANLTAGWRAATGAMLCEFVYRVTSAGFYGAITQAFCRAEPDWAAAAATTVLLPAVSHSVELAIHVLRGTPNLLTSLMSSVAFTVISTLFNLYAMRRGALVVGAGGDSVGTDLRRLPALVCGFLLAGGGLATPRSGPKLQRQAPIS